MATPVILTERGGITGEFGPASALAECSCFALGIHLQVIIVRPAHNIGVHLWIFIFQTWIYGYTFDPIDGQGLKQGGIVDTVITAERRQGATHALCPVTGTKFASVAGDSFDDDFIHNDS